MAVQDIRVRYIVDYKQLDDTNKKLSDISKEEQNVASNAKKMSDAIKRGSKDSSESVKDLNGSIKSIGLTIAAAFTVDKLVSFGKEVIQVRSEFLKLEAVLTNTLGSNSKARATLGEIQAFAAKTNISVLELTQSYVKLANQGFVPTTNELRKLADVANSTGKSFDQLTEAIIDAQTGEFERLKEFGIRASKQGDQVTFAFKGVQTQVGFTSSAIREYITSLGDLNGVQGATAAISETLGGKVSNLGDAYDSLLNTVGERLEPVLKTLIEDASTLLNLTNKLLESDRQAGERQSQQSQQRLQEELQQRISNQIEIDKILKKKYSTEAEARKAATEFIIKDLKEQQEREVALVRGLSISETLAIKARTKSRIEEAEKYYSELIEKEKKLEEERQSALEKQQKKEEDERNKKRIKRMQSGLEKLTKLENDYGSERVRTNKEIEQAALDSQKENTDESINLIQKELDARQAALDAKRDIIDQEIGLLYNLSYAIKGFFGDSQAGQIAALVLEKAAAIATVNIKANEALVSATAQAAKLPIGASEAYYVKQAALINLNRGVAIAGIIGSAIPEMQKFAEGGYTGEGSNRTDSTGERIAGIVHSREFVFDKRKTAKFRPLFEAIHRGEITEKDININSHGVGFDYSQLETAVKRGFRSQPRNEISIDENGFAKHVVSENRRQLLKNKRYSSR